MPTRLIHESLCTSESIARCSPRAQDAFPRTLLYADSYGCFWIQPTVMKGRLWSLRKDVAVQDVEKFLGEYEREGMLQTWEQDGKRYGCFKNWLKFQRTWEGAKRKTPAPPKLAASRSEPQRIATARDELPSVSDSVAVKDLKENRTLVHLDRAQVDEACLRIYETYCKTFGKEPRRYVFTPARKKRVEARLRDFAKVAGGLEQAEKLCLTAIKHRSLSKFHMGDNDKGKQYTDLVDHIFRSYEYAEKLVFDEKTAGEAELENLRRILHGNGHP